MAAATTSTAQNSPKAITTSRRFIPAIVGPTAAGKTELSLWLAANAGFPLEIINADRGQMFRFMDIGTAKPTKDERTAAPHHIFDVIQPDEDYSVWQWLGLAREAIEKIFSRGALPMVVGGTGLYVKALARGLVEIPPMKRTVVAELEKESTQVLASRLESIDPEYARRVQGPNRRRMIRAIGVYESTGRKFSDWHSATPPPEFELRCFGLDWPRAELNARIDERARRMFDGGLVEETRTLLNNGYRPDGPGLRTMGYGEAAGVIAGQLTLKQACEQAARRMRLLAKRQMTWFRGQLDVEWFEMGADKPPVDAGPAILKIIRAAMPAPELSPTPCV